MGGSYIFIGLLVLVSSMQSRYSNISAPTLDFQQRNLDTIKKIYNTTIYPNNQGFIAYGASVIPPGLFNMKASGRITPIGNFTGLEDSVEYFFGLTPPAQPPLYDTWTNAKVVSFTSGCPEVASSVVYGTTTGVNPNASTYGQIVTTIKQVAFWRFDDEGAVLYYDAWLPNLNDYTTLLYGAAPYPQYEEAVIRNLCTEAQGLCTGSNTQYDDTDTCVSTLSAKPFGEWDELWGDNVVCRSLHILLARLRPVVHCPHVGPTGGGKCVNVQYNDVYFDDQTLFGSSDPFMCPGISLD
ncbi:hypothetical protein MMC13_005685 [Lambiella insularis]|nr:hypothetical protein [Lambiella insularis]